MGARKIGAVIALDGEREFKSAVTSCSRSLSTMKSEMNLVEAQTVGSANSLETLRRKHEILSRTLEEQKKKEEEVGKGLEHAKEDYNRVGRELTQYKEKLEQAKSTLREMETAGTATEEEMRQQRETVEELSQTVERGEQTYRRAEDRMQRWERQLNGARVETINATRALNENATYMREAEEAADHCATSIDQFGQRTVQASVSIENTGEQAAALADELISAGNIVKANLINSAVDTIKGMVSGALESAVQGTLDLQGAQRQLQASTGLTAAATREYAQEMQNLYKSGYGEDINEAASAMALVKQYTNETDPTKIKELAENGLALQDTFGMDLSESIRGIDSLMESMGLSAEEAFDYVARGAQNGLDKSGELVDNLAEYGPLWEQAGFSAEEMFTILQNGLDNGAYNLDKVNDYVKEFGVSLADGRVEANINAFSEGTQALFEQWKNGEATTKQVFQSVISDLSSMESQQQALTIASEVWSSLGEDNAMKVITSLNNVITTHENVHGTMKKIKDVKYDTITDQWKVLGRTMQTDVIQPVMVKFLPVAQKGLKLLADNIEEISSVAIPAGAAITTMFAVNKAAKFMKEVKAAGESIGVLVLRVLAHTTATETEATAEAAAATATAAHTAATAAQTVATEGAAVAQTGLNTAMSANPIGLLITGVATFVGVATMLSSCIDDAKEGTSELSAAVEEMQEKTAAAGEALKASTENMAAAMDNVEAEGKHAQDLAEELKELSSQTELTAAEQKRMKTVVMELNSIFPDMGLAIDETTGKLNMATEEMDKYINSMVETKKAEVRQEKLAESIDKVVDAEIARDEVEAAQKETQEKLEEIERKRTEALKAVEQKNKEAEKAQEAYNEAIQEGNVDTTELYRRMNDQSEATVEYRGEIVSVSEALEQMAEDEWELQNVQEENKESLEALNEKIDEANKELEPYIESQQAAADALDKTTDSLKQNEEAAQYSITTAGQELEAYNALAQGQQELAVQVTNSVLTMQNSVTGALESQMNMFEEFDAGAEISTSKLLENMESQIVGVQQWEQNLAALADKGINQDLLQHLAEMGPQGSAYVQAFVNMSAEDFARANDLWGQSVEIKGMTDQWGQELTQGVGELAAGGTEAWNNLAQAMNMQATESGGYVVQGLVTGMKNAAKDLEAAGKETGDSLLKTIDTSLGVASPSKKTMQSGNYVGQGLAIGITMSSGLVAVASAAIAASVVNAVDRGLNKETFVQYGTRISSGIAQGIAQSQHLAVAAAANAALAAAQAAKRKLEINSPSRVFRRLGQGTMEGFALGIQDGEDMARKTVTNAVKFGNVQGKITGKTSGSSGTEIDYNLMGKIFQAAVRNTNVKIYLKDREVTRALKELGAVFA